MFDDLVEGVKSHLEGVFSSKMDELVDHISELLSCCAKEMSIKSESDAVKILLSGIEMRFREEHGALIEAITEHTSSTKAQTSLLEALCNEARTINGKMDVICSLTARIEDIELNDATIANSIKGIKNNTDTVSSFISSLNDRRDRCNRAKWRNRGAREKTIDLRKESDVH